jgi:tetratricopeptide (TPR) repeat protein
MKSPLRFSLQAQTPSREPAGRRLEIGTKFAVSIRIREQPDDGNPMREARQLKPTTKGNRDSDLALALEHHAAGRLGEAETIYQRLHAANRSDSEVIFLLGMLCCDLGLFEAACRFLEQALAITPKFPEASRQWVVALNGWADLKVAAGEIAEAERLLELALQSAPRDAQTLENLGRAALMRGDAGTAEARLVASLVQRPTNAQALNWLGLARLRLEKYMAAEPPLRQALTLQPQLTQASNNLGIVLQQQGRLAEARVCFEAALTQSPDYQNARVNLACTLRLIGKPELARAELEAVLKAQPNAVDALNNLGAVLQDLGQPDLAQQNLLRAIELSPASPETRWNLSLTQLQLGNFKSGWENFESRWFGCETLRGAYQMPESRAWCGQPLQGKRLLLWVEQGFGDTIQFVRFAQDVAARGATVYLLAQPELADLLRRVRGVNTVVTSQDPLPSYDFHCPLMSLPYRLGVALDVQQLHGGAPYLFAEKLRIQAWRDRLRAGQGLKVGLAWAGAARRHSANLEAIDGRRNIALERLTPLLDLRGCTFYSLQKDASSESATVNFSPPGTARGMRDFSSEWRDFSDTAAFVANLDLVISVDTAVAHLAGAIGKPVWLLNRYDSCWRWLLNRSDSPWYSSLRQFRQPAPGDWDSLIPIVTAELANAVACAHSAAASG